MTEMYEIQEKQKSVKFPGGGICRFYSFAFPATFARNLEEIRQKAWAGDEHYKAWLVARDELIDRGLIEG